MTELTEKNILVLLNVYNTHGGASKVAVAAGRYYRNTFKNSYVICNNHLDNESLPDDIIEINNVFALRNFILKNDIDIVHYFLSQHSIKYGNVFENYIKAVRDIKKNIRVLTTVCQQPSSPIAPLTRNVIVNSHYIVFIDKTAFNNPVFSFIPQMQKDWIYLSSSLKESPIDKYIKRKYSVNNEVVIFGRGSTLNKCPKDVVEIYDSIKVCNEKKFIIIGCPESDNWLYNKVKNRADIKTYAILPIEEYADKCSQMDVFLYYLPADSYSSIDGSLGTVMRMGIPVIVYGPQAPKERIEHGTNGFIAETKEDIVKYAEMLASNAKLREMMGKAARQSILDRTPEVDWKDRHIEIIQKLLNSSEMKTISCPLYMELYSVFKNMTGAYKILTSKLFQ